MYHITPIKIDIVLPCGTHMSVSVNPILDALGAHWMLFEGRMRTWLGVLVRTRLDKALPTS